MIAIDTNILIYAFGRNASTKYAYCISLFEQPMLGEEQIIVTNQTLGEFVWVITRKGKTILDRSSAAKSIAGVLASPNWTIHNYTEKTVLVATGAAQPFRDALLAQTLLENGVRELYTENTKDFEGIGIKAINSFLKKINKTTKKMETKYKSIRGVQLQAE